MSRLVGYGVSQVPTNGMLGGMAYQDPINVTVNNISINGAYVSGNLGIGTTNPTSKLTVQGDVLVSGVLTARNIVGTSLSISGISTIANFLITNVGTGATVGGVGVLTYYGDGSGLTKINSSAIVGVATYADIAGIATYADTAGIATYADVAGIATNLKGGVGGNVPYQSSTDVTDFVTNGSSGQVLLFNGSIPIWGNVSAASGSFGGISVQDDNTPIGTANSITTLNFKGDNIVVTATTGANGIATITMSDNLVGTSLSISGISTIANFIMTPVGAGATVGGIGVTYYGDGSNLTGIVAGSAVSISTNTTNQSQFIPYATSIGTTTGLGVTTGGLVFNPSTTRLGIGTTIPISNLDVRGDVSIASTLGIGTVIDIIPYDTLNSGTLSWEGSAGQLFSITNNLTTGSIYSVNDVSGIPSIDVDANGTIQLGPYGGNIGVGTTTPTSKLTIVGDVLVSGVVTATSFSGDGSQLININSSSLVGVVTYADVAGIATYATNAGIATYATNAGIATYADVAGIATYATNAGIATYADNAGIATNVIGGIASVTSLNVTGISTLGTVEISSGIITATTGIVTYYGDGSKLQNIVSTFATYADNAGIATYATNAGIATYATNAGIATNVIGGIASVTSLNITGISTFTNGPIIVGAATSTGTASQPLQVTGGAYVSGNLGIGTTNPTTTVSVAGSFTATDTRIQSLAEESTLVNGNTVNLVYNTGGGNIAICTNPTGPITLNVTGIPTDSTFNNSVLTFTVVAIQTSIGYACTTVNLNGTARTIRYPGSVVSTASTTSYDIFNFTGINTIGSASTTANYQVLGIVNGNFK